MSDKLEACPFCGGEATVSSEACGWRVDCIERNCYTRGPWPDDCTEAEAIAAWNTRTPTPEQAGEVGTALGLDEDGMCDDHYQFGCPKCVAALQSTPPAQPTAGAVERARLVSLLRNLDGETFDGEVTMSSGEAERIIAALQPTGDYVMVPRALMREAQFLCDRLDDLEWGLSMDEFANLHAAHVDPSHSRLKGLLSASPTGGE